MFYYWFLWNYLTDLKDITEYSKPSYDVYWYAREIYPLNTDIALGRR